VDDPGSVTDPRLVCRICGVEVILSDDAGQRMAEIKTFYAAHGSHEEGLGVEARFADTDEDSA
jgi:hypothetical protein